ncbi:MAG: hypothetical protein ACI85I_001341, partial [Arenicella sp.]
FMVIHSYVVYGLCWIESPVDFTKNKGIEVGNQFLNFNFGNKKAVLYLFCVKQKNSLQNGVSFLKVNEKLKFSSDRF